ncbi:MAG: C1 family peptidase [Planctomycetaceae bacterium]
MPAFRHGYRIDLEQRQRNLAELARTSRLLPSFRGLRVPDRIDPRPWHRIENQGSMGSCQGHALSSVCEMAWRIATGCTSQKKMIQFSPLFAYIMSQRKDGISGDQGSTINAGRLTAMQDGCCPLDLCPYPDPVQYTDRISREAIKAAAEFKIRSHSLCRNYDDVFAFLASGQGGVEIGIAWGDQMMECRSGVLERFYPGQGGHAVCFLGYDDELQDRQGRRYLWLANSWSERWGDHGWARVSPAAVDQMCRHQDTVMCGLSDMPVDDDRAREIPDFAGAL